MGGGSFFYRDLRNRMSGRFVSVSRPDKPRRAVTMQQGIYMALDV